MHHRTGWISDIHLGTGACKAKELLEFIKNNTFDTLYLNGDIIDLLALKRKMYWPATHNLVIQKLLRMSRSGTKIIYILGNHDFAIKTLLNEYGVLSLGDIEIRNEFIHTTATGKKIRIVHGDSFDGAIRMFPIIYFLGDKAYDFTVFVNTIYNWFRKLFGYEYFSLAGYIKSKVKGAISFVNNFEKLIVDDAKKHTVDGIFVGHLHTADLKMIDGIIYGNDGDFVDSLTALIEGFDGSIRLVKWNGEVITSM